jgi:DNA repair protein RadC
MGDSISLGDLSNACVPLDPAQHSSNSICNIRDSLVLPGPFRFDVGDDRRDSFSENFNEVERLASILTPLSKYDAVEVAEDLLKEFGSLDDIFWNDDIQSQICSYVDQDVWNRIFSVRQVIRESINSRMKQRPILSDIEALKSYLTCHLAFNQTETALGLFLDNKNGLIREVILASGTTCEVIVYPGEVARRSLQLGAAGVILVHNHPSGDFQPSKSDIRITHKIQDACRTIDVLLIDHIIVARSGWISMRSEGLL